VPFTVRLGVVGQRIAYTGHEHKFSAARNFRIEPAFEAQQYMPFAAPVVCQISSRVFPHTNAYISEASSSPVRDARYSLRLGAFNVIPFGNDKRRAVICMHNSLEQDGKADKDDRVAGHATRAVPVPDRATR
jgi:hypothetical protein